MQAQCMRSALSNSVYVLYINIQYSGTYSVFVLQRLFRACACCFGVVGACTDYIGVQVRPKLCKLRIFGPIFKTGSGVLGLVPGLYRRVCSGQLADAFIGARSLCMPVPVYACACLCLCMPPLRSLRTHRPGADMSMGPSSCRHTSIVMPVPALRG
jgi:hypothetical protein